MNSVVSVASLTSATSLPNSLAPADGPDVEDEVFQLIEQHKAARARFLAAVRADEEQKLEEASDEWCDASDALDQAADALSEFEPRTLAGIAHVAAYFSMLVGSGEAPFSCDVGFARLLRSISMAAVNLSIPDR